MFLVLKSKKCNYSQGAFLDKNCVLVSSYLFRLFIYEPARGSSLSSFGMQAFIPSSLVSVVRQAFGQDAGLLRRQLIVFNYGSGIFIPSFGQDAGLLRRQLIIFNYGSGIFLLRRQLPDPRGINVQPPEPPFVS